MNGISFDASPGEFVAVMGPSGSGKSTFLHLLGGLDKPDAGEVLLEGERISALSDRALAAVRRSRLGFLLQSFSLLPTLSAVENVAFPLLLARERQAASQALTALDRVGLASRASHLPHQMSGGEQQRVALARALVTKPAVVLADEPTGSLDSASSEMVLTLLKDAANAGQTVVVVTHSETVSAYADRVVELVDGQI